MIAFLLIVLASLGAGIAIIAGIAKNSDTSGREEALLALAREKYGSEDSHSLDKLYCEFYRKATRARSAGKDAEVLMRDAILIFNLRNRALRDEAERDSSFTHLCKETSQ